MGILMKYDLKSKTMALIYHDKDSLKQSIKDLRRLERSIETKKDLPAVYFLRLDMSVNPIAVKKFVDSICERLEPEN